MDQAEASKIYKQVKNQTLPVAAAITPGKMNSFDLELITLDPSEISDSTLFLESELEALFTSLRERVRGTLNSR